MIFKDLGLISYEQGLAQQKRAVDEVIGGGEEQVFFCEHDPVLTLGRLADRRHILFSETELLQRGIKIFEVDRGGEVTLHAPGQLMVYPILDLRCRGKDLHKYVYTLERLGIDFLRGFDIVSCRAEGKTGVWVGEKKVISLGVGVKQWVAYHGLGINMCTQLELFSMIRPCGLNVEMASVSSLLEQDIAMNEAKQKCKIALKNVFGGL